jgi:methionyl-tRNA formyltransferase
VDARVYFDLSALQIERWSGLLSPEPGAWCSANIQNSEDTLKLLRARAVGTVDWGSLDGAVSEPGRVSQNRGKVFVSCGGGSLLELLEVQPAGKKPMVAADWLRGFTSDVVLS